MAPASALCSSVHSITDKAIGSTVDRPEFDIKSLSSTYEYDSFDGLSQSFRQASVETHCLRTLEPKPHYIPIHEPPQDLCASGSSTILLNVPPCTPADSQYLQDVSPDQNLTTDMDITPTKKAPIMLPVESSDSLNASVVDLFDPLTDATRLAISDHVPSGVPTAVFLKEDAEDEWTLVYSDA